ncbi:EF hand [Shewanella psychrophila]|uniref:EF hand n=1 Tax=Shewanella psychrophila TaxID=225848 RepID=A0A1S6HR66_9GAMM|nr:EF-hand domain-containing protein [Shewanella psychrophila]AQS37991.1 EF hand [Shewanella psychrophila]
MTHFHQVTALTLCMLLASGCANNENSKGGGSLHTFDFEKLDIDGDGNISKQEFLDLVFYSRSPEQRFSQLDRDSDGYLSQSELNSISLRRRQG